MITWHTFCVTLNASYSARWFGENDKCRNSLINLLKHPKVTKATNPSSQKETAGIPPLWPLRWATGDKAGRHMSDETWLD